jgi:hypothetical protein
MIQIGEYSAKHSIDNKSAFDQMLQDIQECCKNNTNNVVAFQNLLQEKGFTFDNQDDYRKLYAAINDPNKKSSDISNSGVIQLLFKKIAKKQQNMQYYQMR